jgi:hypothetical protein
VPGESSHAKRWGVGVPVDATFMPETLPLRLKLPSDMTLPDKPGNEPPVVS